MNSTAKPGMLDGLFGKKKPKDPEKTPSSECTNNRSGSKNTIQSMNPGATTSTSSSLLEITEHDYTIPIIKLQVNNVDIFTIQESRVSKFAFLNKLIEEARRKEPENNTPIIVVHGDSDLPSDFRNAFDLLDTSFIEPIDFSLEVLISAARISATYDYPPLHAFCIKQLEELSLHSIERLRVGRVLNLRLWEERAYQELSERDEAITKEEMLVLGIDAYFQVASMRDRRQKDQIKKLSSELRTKTTPQGPAYEPNTQPNHQPRETQDKAPEGSSSLSSWERKGEEKD